MDRLELDGELLDGELLDGFELVRELLDGELLDRVELVRFELVRHLGLNWFGAFAPAQPAPLAGSVPLTHFGRTSVIAGCLRRLEPGGRARDRLRGRRP